jgi:hypothetical protein
MHSITIQTQYMYCTFVGNAHDERPCKGVGRSGTLVITMGTSGCYMLCALITACPLL